MKMTMHIDEDVLAEVMALTGAKTKTDAVEMALRDLARRHKQRRLFRTPLYDSDDQWAADTAPKPSDLLDPPDIDPDSVNRFNAALEARRRRQQAWLLNEGPPPPAPPSGGDAPPAP